MTRLSALFNQTTSIPMVTTMRIEPLSRTTKAKQLQGMEETDWQFTRHLSVASSGVNIPKCQPDRVL